MNARPSTTKRPRKRASHDPQQLSMLGPARPERTEPPLWVGVDENGLGPRLGPLVATACALETSRKDASASKLGASLGIADSKVSSGFGSMAHAEGLALAIAAQSLGRTPEHADDVLAAISLDGLDTLRAPCPSTTRAQCWSSHSVPAFGGELAQGREILASLGDARGRTQVVRVRSAILCAHTYNAAVARRGSKLDVDLELFERLLLDVRGATGRELRAVCGMVGGIRRYPQRFLHLDAAHTTTIEEARRRASYYVEDLGDVTFEVDADASSLPVALASMVGKYVRELAMARQNAFYRGHDPELPEVSGYHDAVTGRFVEASRLLRAKLEIRDGCFERTS
jgi:ribonuclease HII